MPVVRIQERYSDDWWMNNRRFYTPTKLKFGGQQESRGSESPTDSVTLSRVRVRF
ncbi:hypothetical protein [Nostoc sp.]|uniref:hypothetical protein n=1 Tax=Nostoc sp. TaxID=1180 RepID=UPI002FF92CC3